MHPHSSFDENTPASKKEILLAELTNAINQKNVMAARKVFEKAFWNRIQLKPEWHHLLRATLNKDKKTTRLLIIYGANWSDQEIRCIKEISSSAWGAIKETLYGTDISFRVKNVPRTTQVDSYKLAVLSQIIASQHADFQINSWNLESAQSQGISECCQFENLDKAVSLLRYKNQNGVINFEKEFEKLLFSLQKDKALHILDEIRKKGLNLKPLSLGYNILRHPSTIIELKKRGLFSPESQYRIEFIKAWSAAKKKPSFYEECTPENYKKAAAFLFPKEYPLTKNEITNFIKINEYAKPLYEDLKEVGFFNDPLWTTEQFRLLSKQNTDSSFLEKEFNRKLAQDLFNKMSGKDIVKQKNFSLFVSAHEKGFCRASGDQAKEIFSALWKQYKKDPIPFHVKSFLKKLKENNAFTAFKQEKNNYIHYGDTLLCKNEPGLAKILLDLDILTVNDFSDFTLKKRSTSGIWGKENVPFSEFLYQVKLEKLMPDVFIPARGKVKSYRQSFKKISSKKHKPSNFFKP